MSEENKTEYAEVHEEPRRMSEEDVNDYRGLTLNENGEQDRNSSEEEFQTAGIRVQFFDLKAIPWWKKAMWIAAAMAFLVLVAVMAWFFFLWSGVVFLAGGIVYLLKKYIF